MFCSSKKKKGILTMTKTKFGCATVTMVIIGLWVCGCQEQQTPDTKTARLIALENKELKAQMQAETKKRDDEIQKLKEQIQANTKKHNDEVQSISNVLTQCEHDRTEGIKETEQKNKEQIESMLSGVIAENQKLTAEIERLNAEIAKLKGQ
jgi:hypothetical protein